MSVKSNPSAGPLRVVVVGAGRRSKTYASYALGHPKDMQITAVVDPDATNRNLLADLHHVPAEYRFADVADMVAHRRAATGQAGAAQAAINGTMDLQHVPTSLPLLEAGLDLLLEKPIATSREDLVTLADVARRCGRKVMICHVLRYAPFYVEIRKRIAAGELGEIISIQTAEHVGFGHMASAMVRGKWNRKDVCGSSMLMAKCCHDLDLITWLKGDVAPVQVSSMGGLMHYRPDKAPPGAGRRCLVDCKIEPQCPFSCRRLYVERGLFASLPFPMVQLGGATAAPTSQQKLESLRNDNPYGRCVWHCDNDLADHQSVVIQFADGATAIHNVVCTAARGGRHIHVIGAKAEIQGMMEENYLTIRRPDLSDKKGSAAYSQERIDIGEPFSSTASSTYSQESAGVDEASMHKNKRSAHGGGDMGLMEDFVRFVRDGIRSISCTCLEDSVRGHMVGFAADDAMVQRRVVQIGL